MSKKQLSPEMLKASKEAAEFEYDRSQYIEVPPSGTRRIPVSYLEDLQRKLDLAVEIVELAATEWDYIGAQIPERAQQTLAQINGGNDD